MKKFSDFATEAPPFKGEQMKLKDLLNKEIKIIDFKVEDSKYRDKNEEIKFYTTICFELDNEPHICFTGSDVLRNQLEKYKDELPFMATIVQIERYYTLT